MSGLFEELERERAAGHVYTLRDWLARNPPSENAFRQTVAGIARRAIDGEPFFTAVREFLDEFSLRSTDAMRSGALRERPPSTSDPRHDAYLGALAEHLAAVHALERPAWSCEADRFLDRFWFPSQIVGFRAIAIASCPAAFRRRGVFVDASSLVRV